VTLDDLVRLSPQVEVASAAAGGVLAGWIRELRDSLGRAPLCAEVGTWCGLTAVEMALSGALVLCVDPFTGADDQTRARVGQLGGSTLERFLANAWAVNIGRSVLPLVGRSPEVAGLLPDGAFDLVFLDGDHSKEAVCADMLAWAPKIRAGGVLCGHDASQPEISAAVRESLAILGWPGSIAEFPDQVWRTNKP
jgi:hypothetical protein